jgi:hypothetical protein
MCGQPQFLIETGAPGPQVSRWWLCRDCDAPLERTERDEKGRTIRVWPRETPCWLPRIVT